LSASYVDLFRHRRYRLLWTAQLVNQLGDAVTRVALPLYVYYLTRSPLDLSFTAILQLLPIVCVGPAAGVYVDRVGRKPILVAVNLGRACLIACLTIARSMEVIYLITFLSATLEAVYRPCHSAVVPEILPRRLYMRAAALTKLTFQAANVAGPAIGGIVVAALGVSRAFTFDVATFVAAATIISALAIPPVARGVSEGGAASWTRDFFTGLRYLKRQSVLWYITLLTVVRSAGAGIPLVVTVIYVEEVLGLGAQHYGYIMASVSVGYVIGSVAAASSEGFVPRRTLILGGTLLWAATYLPCWLEPSFGILAALWLLGGFGQSAASVAENVCFAELTSNEVRGRVYSVANGIVTAPFIAAMLCAGTLTRKLGVGPIISVGGALMFLGALVLTRLSPAYQRIDERPLARGRTNA